LRLPGFQAFHTYLIEIAASFHKYRLDAHTFSVNSLRMPIARKKAFENQYRRRVLLLYTERL